MGFVTFSETGFLVTMNEQLNFWEWFGSWRFDLHLISSWLILRKSLVTNYWLSLPTSLHQLLYRLSRDNLKHLYLPNLSHHFKLLFHICVPCPRSYLAYATLITNQYVLLLLLLLLLLLHDVSL